MMTSTFDNIEHRMSQFDCVNRLDIENLLQIVMEECCRDQAMYAFYQKDRVLRYLKFYNYDVSSLPSGVSSNDENQKGFLCYLGDLALHTNIYLMEPDLFFIEMINGRNFLEPRETMGMDHNPITYNRIDEIVNHIILESI